MADAKREHIKQEFKMARRNKAAARLLGEHMHLIHETIGRKATEARASLAELMQSQDMTNPPAPDDFMKEAIEMAEKFLADLRAAERDAAQHAASDDAVLAGLFAMLDV